MRIAALLLGMAIFGGAEDPSSPKAKDSKAKPTGIRRLSPTLICDFDKKQLELDAEVVFREGPLELFLCPKRTKEHESILAAEVRPRLFQLALLMIGAEQGSPANFDGTFKPPTGQKIEIRVEYTENGEKKSIDARQWIRDSKSQRPLDADFVFAGSRFERIPGSDRPVWLAEDGDLICVSNFPGSVVDIAAKSSNLNSDRMYEAWTDRIPPRGEKVRVIFKPIKTVPAKS